MVIERMNRACACMLAHVLCMATSWLDIYMVGGGIPMLEGSLSNSQISPIEGTTLTEGFRTYL